jgi:hypothetical protein
VVSNFFYPRWKMFLDYANNTLLNGETFDQSYINNQMFTELEQPFTVDQTEFPTEPTGDTIQIARNIHDKWSPIFKSSRKNY